MNIGIDEIKKLIEDAGKKGFKVSVRDIAFVILNEAFDNVDVAYKCLFGSDEGFIQEYATAYSRTGAIEYVKDYIELIDSRNKGKKKKGKKQSDDDDISFDENKAYMLKLKKDTEKAMEDGDIEKKDGLKILADISVKLNDKFNVKDANDDGQVVIVQSKFNAICECGREIYIPTKEDLMEKYGLVENNNSNNNL